MRKLFLILAAVSLTACAGDSTGIGVGDPIGGAFQLQTINGAKLPFTYSNGETVTSEVLSLYLDGSYIDVQQLSDGNFVPEKGSYVNSNNTITFSPQGSTSTYNGSYTPSTTIKITFADGTAAVYQRTQ